MAVLETSLSLDLHCHLERDEDIPLLADLTADDLDVLAITNHTNKRAIILGQAERIEKLAALRPDLLLLYGLEWNLFGAHVNIIFPAVAAPEAYITAFLDGFEPCGDSGKLSAALEFLAAFPATEKPLLILNHPAHSSEALFPELMEAFSSGQAPIPIGVDGFHGHQKWPQKFPDPFDYPGSKPGGVCDAFYQKGVRLPLLGGSDFHPNKYEDKPDYPPGSYQRILLSGVDKDREAVLAALKEGRTVVDQNRTAASAAFSCARVGAERDIEVTAAITALRPIERLEVISGSEGSVTVDAAVSIEEPGEHNLVFLLRESYAQYIRLRGKSIGPNRCDSSETRTAAFLTSACFLEQ
jgi:hypothetical protein